MKRNALLATGALASSLVMGVTLLTTPATAAVAPEGLSVGATAERKTVCAEDLFVRATAPHGAWIGTLKKGQTFLVEQPGGNWVYGFAYGDINRRGWVQNGWFC
ncbi:hypothetical protein JGS22_008235 [Streptomyces sp. P38-E01]|uniref:SH3 domain-containing protein n=1 Tax=Streptomyces tardus TaxID=2780544 RepID=A0A949JNZ3_9ACTN|nr:hypothetical protein [Streptomyces tardus]MBU7597610.1 hypothetical protein [Streptomyces tardus]